MAYKNILVYLDNYRGADTRLQLSVSLAAPDKARLVALYGFDLPRPPLSRVVAGVYVEDNVALTAYERERDDAFNRAAHCEAEFRSATKRANIRSNWQILPDKPTDLVALLTEQARYADLAVLGQADSDHPAFDTLAKLPETVLLGCGRPVMIVPYACNAKEAGKCILIAWNGTREAARAVRDALPLLHRAESVTVLSVGSWNDTSQPATLLVDYLATHDIRAAASHLSSSGDASTGELVLSRTADLGCDLIVMGGYGHSRTRELLLGGVTREVLRHMTVPVLMSH